MPKASKLQRIAKRKIEKINGLFFHKGRKHVLRDYEVKEAVILRTDHRDIVITDESELDELKKVR